MTSVTTNNRLVSVRSKRTGETEICRASNLSKQTCFHVYIHFIGRNPKRHHEKVHYTQFGSDSFRKSFVSYLGRLDLESCTVARFLGHKEQRKNPRTKNRLHVDDSYLTREGTTLYNGSNHRSHSHSCSCNNSTNRHYIESYQVRRKHSSYPKERRQTGFDYCSQLTSSAKYQSEVDRNRPKAVYHTSRRRKSHSHRSSESLEMQSLKRKKHVRPVDMKYLRCGPRKQPDVPKRVWKAARPSAWIPRYGTDSSLSTPLGSAFTPLFPTASVEPISPTSLPRVRREPQCALSTTKQSEGQKDARIDECKGSSRTSTSSRVPGYYLFDMSSLQDSIESIETRVHSRKQSIGGLHTSGVEVLSDSDSILIGKYNGSQSSSENAHVKRFDRRITKLTQRKGYEKHIDVEVYELDNGSFNASRHSNNQSTKIAELPA